jgi:long-chain acyl-CoA synthetase
MEAEAQSLAPGLQGLDPGSVIALQPGNHPQFPAMLLALWRLGLIPVALDGSLDGTALANALETCGAAAILDSKGISRLKPNPPCLAPDTALLKFTSGTTGAARAIRFTAAQLIADCDAICDTMGIRDGDVNFGVIPWSHSYGFSNLVLPLLCRGIPVVASEDRLPRAILDGLTRTGATVFPGLPVLFQKLAQFDGAMPSLRLCISAGAPLQAATAREFHSRFGVKVHSFYGSSECGGIAYDASDDEVPEGCVGPPMRGVVLDYDGDDPCRITVRGPAVGLGYFPEGDPALEGGRFTPGDLVRRTPHGLVLAGRVSDFINVAGRKLNPAAVEAVLRACPGVREVVVFGVPNPLRGEEPVACVVGDAPVELLRAHCATLPAWQAPRDYWLLDALPVNERGKLSRLALAQAFATRGR